MLSSDTFINHICPPYMGTLRSNLSFIERAILDIQAIDKKLEARLKNKGSIAVDVFAGSGSVSWKLRDLGFIVHANDIERYTAGWLHAAVTITKDKLLSEVKELYDADSIENAIQHFFEFDRCTLDKLKTYSSDTGNNYFSINNGTFIETSFQKLEKIPKTYAWFYFLQGYLTTLCIKYANSPGTFQQPYKTWGSGNKERANLLQSDIQPCSATLDWLNKLSPIGKVYHLDALLFANRFGTNAIDIAFINPPCTTRQYSSYYNALNIFQNGSKESSPSILSKKASARAYMGRLIQTWSDKAKWLILNYAENGLIPIDELIVMLNLCGKNKVSVYQQTHSKYRNGKTTTITQQLLIVQTNTWQSPTDIQTVVREWRKSESKRIKEDSYIDPLKLNTKIFKLETYALGWNVYVRSRHFAKIHHTRKVLSCDNHLLTSAQEKAWSQAVLNPIELFKLYISEKKWPKAIKLLRIWRKQKVANTAQYAQLLYSVLHAQGIHKYANLIKDWRYEKN